MALHKGRHHLHALIVLPWLPRAALQILSAKDFLKLPSVESYKTRHYVSEGFAQLGTVPHGICVWRHRLPQAHRTFQALGGATDGGGLQPAWGARKAERPSYGLRFSFIVVLSPTISELLLRNLNSTHNPDTTLFTILMCLCFMV